MPLRLPLRLALAQRSPITMKVCGAVIARELVSHSVEQISDWHAIDMEDVRGIQDLLAG